MSPKEKFDAANALRKDFDAAAVKKSFDTTKRAEAAMQKAFELSTRPGNKSRIGSDQALGVLFQKLLDPESVVRESEYARTPEGAALIARIRAFPGKIIQGGLGITDEDRRNLLETAKAVIDADKAAMNEHINRFSIIADESGLNKKIIFGNIKPFDIKTSEIKKTDSSGARSNLPTLGETKTISGITYTYIGNGQWSFE
ncbi:hypothetical protein IID62_11325 [candidate division KSB1 bacterium]|nr:hypothetical protein [candidate division KSB1 bacterium]